jgi:hypothetical protein
VSPVAHRSVYQPLSLLLLAGILASTAFLVHGHSGINLADEGFLWYGMQQTVEGQVPLRDFESYDPGRYYWSAASALLLGRSLIALRVSETAIQVLGLWAGLLAASRLTRNWGVLGGIGIMLTAWMFPSHKLFDHALLLSGIWTATRMVERPTRGRVIWAGLFVGLCTFFGRNHALYNGAAQLILLLLLWLKLRSELRFSRLVVWWVSIALGMLPLLVMIVFVHGFFASYEDSIAAIFRTGTNLALPIPWPWRISFSGDAFELGRRILLSFFMIALPAAYLAALAVCAFRPARFLQDHALLAACGAVGLFYLHHAYSRADLSHLAQAIHPFLLGLLSFAFLCRRRQVYLVSIAALLLAIGLFELVRQMPCYQRLTSKNPWIRCEAASGVFLPPTWARSLDALARFTEKNIAPDEGIFIAPAAPGLYPMLARAAPVWETYVLFPATEKRQEEINRALTRKGVNWAIVSNTPPDQRDDLRFSATYPRVWDYLMRQFQPVPDVHLPGKMVMLHRRGVSRAVP